VTNNASDNAFDFVVPGNLDARTGGYIYDKRIIDGLQSRGWQVNIHALDSAFPTPTTAALSDAEKALSSIPANSCVVIDGLAFGAMPEIAARQAERLRMIALVHHPLALETGLQPAQADRHRHDESRALESAHHVITTSPYTTAVLCANYGVPEPRISTVRPGTDSAPLATGSSPHDAQFNLLCVATLTARKGHDILLAALHQVADLPWRLTCVGSASMDPDTTRKLRAQIQALSLQDRVILTDELEEAELSSYYLQADAFVFASHYEGYGMALDEALARGLPIVTTNGGAIPTTVPPSAGLFVPVGDADALAVAIRRLLSDEAVRIELRDGAQKARDALSTWSQACDEFAAVVQRVSQSENTL